MNIKRLDTLSRGEKPSAILAMAVSNLYRKAQKGQHFADSFLWISKTCDTKKCSSAWADFFRGEMNEEDDFSHLYVERPKSQDAILPSFLMQAER